MPRTARNAPGGMIFHVFNWGNARDEIFSKDADFAAFESTATHLGFESTFRPRGRPRQTDQPE